MQRRLVHIASTHKLGDPARLFVCPDLVSRIESLEISQAAHEKERKRLEEFFAQFKSAAFGEAPSDALSGKGGS
jgi:hypothetical protein